jgi:3-hydroxyisobutyrate dehydrogenase-like beta-hydroxyacid dehydrogenase
VRVAFCGLGNMGAPMAERLVGAGLDVTVWNRSKPAAERLAARGATVAGSPKEAAAAAELTVTMLADGEALEEVVFGPSGASEGLRAGSVLMDMSTIGPDAARSAAGRLLEGVGFVDAPVKGGPAKAAAGELRILVGGAADDVERAAPVLGALGTWTHLGAVGTGAAAKVLNNYAVITLVSVLGEAVALADALGLQEELALDVLSKTPLAASAQRQWPRVAGEGASFKLRLAAKDLALGVEAAAAGGRDLRLGAVALERLREAERAGLGEEDQARVVARIRALSEAPPGA